MPNTSDLLELQRAVGRVERAVEDTAQGILRDRLEFLSEIKEMREELLREIRGNQDDLDRHQNADTVNSGILIKTIEQNRDKMNEGFSDQSDKREELRKDLMVELRNLTRNQDFVRGAGWVVIGVFGAVGLVIINRVIPAVWDWIKLAWGGR